MISTSFLALATTPPSEAGGPDMTRYLMVCALLLALIGALAFLFKRFVAGAVRARAARRSLQILDVLPLGGKQRMCVVRCYDRTFALGLGDKEVALIAELDPVVAPEASGAGVAFGEHLEKAEARPGLVGSLFGMGRTPAARPTSGAKKRSLFGAGGVFG